MKHYTIDITWNDPYPKNFTYREDGSSIAVALGKAVRNFRKEQKGRRIKSLVVKITQI